jgi:hypothetical protein
MSRTVSQGLLDEPSGIAAEDRFHRDVEGIRHNVEDERDHVARHRLDVGKSARL